MGYDAAPRPRRLQGALLNIALHAHFDAFTGIFEALPHTSYTPIEKPPSAETRALTGACHQSLCIPGAFFYSIRITSPPECIAIKRRVWGWNICSLRGALAAISCTLIPATYGYAPGGCAGVETAALDLYLITCPQRPLYRYFYTGR